MSVSCKADLNDRARKNCRPAMADDHASQWQRKKNEVLSADVEL